MVTFWLKIMQKYLCILRDKPVPNGGDCLVNLLTISQPDINYSLSSSSTFHCKLLDEVKSKLYLFL